MLAITLSAIVMPMHASRTFRADQSRDSRWSIRNYLFRVFDKLGVSTRVELVLYCLQERQKEAIQMGK